MDDQQREKRGLHDIGEKKQREIKVQGGLS